MKRVSNKILAILFACAFCSISNASFAQEEQIPNPPQTSYGQAVQTGDWLWIDNSSGILNDGVEHVYAPQNDPQTVYAAGRGYLAKSSDAGITWHVVLTFNENGVQTGEISPEELEQFVDRNTDPDQRIAFLREYIATELSSQFGDEYADYLLDNITDGDLDVAEDVDAIDALSNLNLSMETDLNDVYSAHEDDELESISAIYYDDTTFVKRLENLTHGGMEFDNALTFAAGSDILWKILPTNKTGELFITTSDALYHTKDKANSWKTTLAAQENEKFLALTTTQNDNTLILGTTEGLRISHDHGDSWSYTQDTFGVPVHHLWGNNKQTVIAQTTDAIYLTTDNALTWSKMRTPHFEANSIRDVHFLYNTNAFALLSNRGIFITENNGQTWTNIPTDNLDENEFIKLKPLKEDLSQFLLLAPNTVYFYNNGQWLTANNGLFGQKLLDVSPETSPDGSLWLATSIGVFRGSPYEKNAELSEKMRTFQRQIAAEPDAYTVVKHAIIASGLDEIQENSFVTRAGCSFLLPKLSASYRFFERRDDAFQRRGSFINPDFSNLTFQELLNSDYELQISDYDGRASAYNTYGRPQTHTWEIFAQWDLGYNKIRASRSAAQKNARLFRTARSQLAKNVLKIYLKRRATQMKLFSASPKKKTNKKTLLNKINQHLLIAELESNLNALTNGFFGIAVNAQKK